MRPSRFPLFSYIAAAILLTVISHPAAGIDLNANGVSDIWELVFGAAGLDPQGDADADGVSNLQESIAGTDPFDPNSAPRITAQAINGSNIVVTISAAAGKQYQLQSTPAVADGVSLNWTTETIVVARGEPLVTLNAAMSAAARFFRVAVSDVDSDSDGVTDWEEYQLGLDPFRPASNGQLDANGKPLSDYDYVAGKLALQNVISISATDPTANQPDPGQPPLNLGVLTVTRGGFPLNDLTVSLAPAGSAPGIALEGVDYALLPRTIYFPVGVSSLTLTVTPLANTNLAAPVVATVALGAGAGYRLGPNGNASVVIYPSATPVGAGLTAQYFTNSSATYSSSANFNPANLVLTRTDPTIDFTWSNTSGLPIPSSGYYTVRWTGQIQPEYTETYYFDAFTDDGVKLWVNDQLVIDSWAARGAADAFGSIQLLAGVRYDVQMDYFNGGGGGGAHLSWYSASQPKQVVPATRLYPSSTAPAPSAVICPLSAVGFVGQPFSFTVAGANSASSFTANAMPPGLTFNPSTGLLAGTPNVAGDYPIMLTASNSAGLGASVLDLQIIDSGSSVVREVWSTVPGTNISDIPLSLPPTTVETLGTLEGITGYGQNYAERVRGFFTAPVTGNYYFWLAASDSAELWISDDVEPVNRVRRAFVLPGGTAPRQWNLQSGQRSPWLALVAGQRYYLEILHKAGPGTNDNWAVGWLQDPTGTSTLPSDVVPGYVLGRYYSFPVTDLPGTLYAADLLPEPNVVSHANGSATLRVSADNSQAVLKFSYSGLTAPVTGKHIHCDPYLNSPSQIIFDIDAATPQSDGSYLWTIGPVGTLSAADITEIIREGKAYLNIHTVNYPGGEINGHFTPASGTQNFMPPPPAPPWTDDHSSADAAARFLIQATFGPSRADVAAVQALGYEGWIDNQLSLPTSHQLPFVLANVSSDPTRPYPSSLTFSSWWQQSLTAPDQLRQRIAFALSEILVVSEEGVLQDNARALSSYYDTLLDNAFGNFRSLLEAVTLSPAMGNYLDMRGNDKGSLITGIHANENFAREVLQLFSIGLNRMWPDGTLVMNSQSALVPTYDQNVIMGFASVFTGWNYYQPNQANGRLPTNFSPPSNYTNPMVLVPTHHELGAKLLLDNVMLPPAWATQTNPASADFDSYGLGNLEAALDTIFNHPNVGPFVCRQLIQRLVTSNPSRDYLYRVVQKFNDNGAGIRGDMQAVIKAILLDYEARSSAIALQPTFGKQREPLLRGTATVRAFPAPPANGGTYNENGTRTVTVTTTNAHRLNSGDTVFLSFTDLSGQPAPRSQAYSVTVTSSTSFTMTAPGALSGTYTQAQNVSFTNITTGTSNLLVTNIFTTNVITVIVSGNGLVPGNPVFLVFTTGGASNGLYQVLLTNSTSSFVVATTDTNTLKGSCLLPKLSVGGYTQRGTNITVSTSGPHGLQPGDQVFINFTSGTAAKGEYQILSVPDATHFVVGAAKSASQTQNSLAVYPLVMPSLVRSGAVAVVESTFGMGYTDSSLTQTPLRSPTVFNFFFPDYQFPGTLAAAGLTTPEFQLTSDTSVAVQMNFLQGGLLNNTGNSNGLSSFVGGNGALVLDLGPWLAPAYTSNSGIPSLVDALGSLLTGDQVAGAAKNAIVAYVANTANFPFSSPPTDTEMRDRVRAVVHLLVTSPDFTIQR